MGFRGSPGYLHVDSFDKEGDSIDRVGN